MEGKLENIHSQINDLLKFAEAKNAGLLTFNGIIIVEGLKNIYEYQESLNCWVMFALIYIIFFNAISFLICLSSLFPNRKSIIKLDKKKDFSNLLFYGTVATLNETEYLSLLKSKYNLQPMSESYCLDLARQLIIQSEILTSKLKKFKIASIFTFCAFATPLGYLVYLWFLKPKNED